LLVAVPADNLAARVVERSAGGLVVPPTNPAALVDAAQTLLDDEALRAELGLRARAYAETAFNVDAIAARFERVLEEATR
jgi:glycosyltransferase involved in cell wall biosynthesis